MKLKHGLRSALLVTAILLVMPSAAAHAVLVFSNPAVDARLKAMPATVEVEFDGNLIAIGGAKTNFLTVQDSQGRQIDLGNSKVAGPILTVGIKTGSRTGIFTVSWRVLSSDGHPVEGSYQFSVGNVVVTPSPKSTTPRHSPKENFWVHHRSHIVLLIGLLVAIGIWAGYERARRKLK